MEEKNAPIIAYGEPETGLDVKGSSEAVLKSSPQWSRKKKLYIGGVAAVFLMLILALMAAPYYYYCEHHLDEQVFNLTELHTFCDLVTADELDSNHIDEDDLREIYFSACLENSTAFFCGASIGVEDRVVECAECGCMIGLPLEFDDDDDICFDPEGEYCDEFHIDDDLFEEDEDED